MPVTSLFFLTPTSADSSPAQDLIYRLSTTYECTPLPPWTLSHRLFRETPSPTQSARSSPTLDAKPPVGQQRYLQVLSLSHHAPRTYVAIAATHASSQTRTGTPAPSQNSGEAIGSGEPARIISIPAGGASDEFTQLIVSKFGPLWQQRQVLHVAHGTAFEIGEFRIRIGELKQGYGGGTQMARGAVCEVEWIGGGEDWENGDKFIRGFWEGLEVKGAREVFWVAGLGEGESTIRQWCEILRIRS